MRPAYENDKEALMGRLHRIEGQVRGVARMVEEDQYCIDVLTQIAAVKAAIDRVGMLLLKDHIKGCVVEAARAGDEAKLDELVRAVDRFART